MILYPTNRFSALSSLFTQFRHGQLIPHKKEHLAQPIALKDLPKHETKRHILVKFVLCTPIADAGFLIDFPLRLATRIRMFHAEMIVWTIAISLNLYAFFYTPTVYTKTKILILFHDILNKPLPFWGIIAISLVGTFVSIHFGDELLDKIKHRERKSYQKYKRTHQFIIMAFVIAMSIILYDILLTRLGINLPI